MPEESDPAVSREYERLVEEHYRFIYRFLYWLHPTRGTAEDLTQETYLRAWRGMGNRRGGRETDRAWLVAIARRVAQDHARQPRVVTVPLEAAVEVRDGCGSPADRFLEEETDRALREALAALPEPYRTAVVLAKVEELDTQEIARLLRIPRGTVKWRVARGLHLLRARLNERRHPEETQDARVQYSLD